MKSSELEFESKFDSKQDKAKRIIDAKINATITTAEIQPKEPKGSASSTQMWVKGTPLHFIIDNNSHKNLTSVEVIKMLKVSTTPHPQPYTIG